MSAAPGRSSAGTAEVRGPREYGAPECGARESARAREYEGAGLRGPREYGGRRRSGVPGRGSAQAAQDPESRGGREGREGGAAVRSTALVDGFPGPDVRVTA